jgi:hypothetical protein
MKAPVDSQPHSPACAGAMAVPGETRCNGRQPRQRRVYNFAVNRSFLSGMA